MERDRRKLIEKEWFEDFGNGLALAGGKCPACDKVYFPPKRICPQCFEENQGKSPLSTRGTLHTFAVSHMGPAGIPTPYVIGFVDLPEGIRLFSLITQCEPWDRVLRVDMAVEMVFGTIRREPDGTEITGYMFRPVPETSP